MDSATIAQQIAEYDKNKVTSTDALNEALTKFGVPEIRNTVSGLRTTLANTTNAYNAVDPSVTGRTQGSLVTEAQRSRQVNNERAPIAAQIGEQGKSLTDNQQALTDALGQATTQATNKVNDYNTGRAALQSQYDTTYKSEQDRAAAAAAASAAAEQRRQFDVSQANENARAYASSSSKAANDAAKSYSAKASKSGGYSFTAANGRPVSMYDYSQATGTSMLDLLKASGDPKDKQAYKDAVYWLGKGGEDLALKNLQIKYKNMF